MHCDPWKGKRCWKFKLKAQNVPLWGEVRGRGSLGQVGAMKSCCFSSVFYCLLQVASTFWKAVTVLYALLIWDFVLNRVVWLRWQLIENLWVQESMCTVAACAVRHCFEALWKEVMLPLSTVMSLPSLEAFSCQILALDSWPLNVGREKLTLFCPHSFVLQEAVLLAGYP